MNINIIELHELIDGWYQKQIERQAPQTTTVVSTDLTGAVVSINGEPARKLPEGKRVVRTKGQGDKVFLLDEVAKTRQWMTKPEVLDSLGFKMEDVVEIDDNELMKYPMTSPIFKPVDGPA